MVEPITWVPSAAGTMPAATAAAEPLDEPPGVRAVSQGFLVPRGVVAANSVVTVLPRMTAPASRSAATAAASRPVSNPVHSGEPCPVGMSMVSMISLMPTGMPSIGDNGAPARQRAVARSALARAPSTLSATKAPMSGSQRSRSARQSSRKSRGVLLPDAKPAVAGR
jgi:hypothetical protein